MLSDSAHGGLDSVERAPAIDPREFLPPVDLSAVPDAWLSGEAPVEIDLGCGKGTFLIEMARRSPDRRFIGVERQIERVRKSAGKARRLGVSNAVIVRAECGLFMEALPTGSVAGIHVLFPDPWPKRRHHPRRLVQGAFLEQAWRALSPGGFLDLLTDHPGYFRWMKEEVKNCGRFRECSWPEDPARPLTDFEKLFRGRGMTIHQMRLEPLS